MRSLADVTQAFAANPDTGLADAAVEHSRQQFGRNVLTPLPREPLWKKFIEKFDEPIIIILLAAALLSMVVDIFKEHTLTGGVCFGLLVILIAGAYVFKQRQWVPTLMFVSAISLFFVGIAGGHFLVEGLAVMVAVILATGVAFASEYKSDREFEVLNAHKDSIKSKVFRNGHLRSIAVEEVVVGDVILLETGDEIPADGRLLKATELMIDQSLMTGESEPVRKLARPQDTADGPDQPGCIYRGTQVIDGAAHMIVTEVGDQTYLGQIARRLSADPEEKEETKDTEAGRVKRKLTISKELTPLQQKLTQLANLISKVGYLAALLIFLAQFIRGILVGEVFWPANSADLLSVLSELLGYFVTMVIIIVVAVPEGLPMSVTVSLALAMQKMTRANSLVRQLVACETIGSATVICSDKTGTLTQNKMQVDRISWDDMVFDRGSRDWVQSLPSPAERGVGGEGKVATGKPIDWIALISAVDSTANLEEKQGKTVTIGNSTEGALLQWLREAGIEYGELRLQNAAIYQVHFTSERKRMTTVARVNRAATVREREETLANNFFALVKGAPEWLLDSCAQYLAADGAVRALNDEMRQAIQQRLGDAAGKAMRTLAFAYAPLPTNTPTDVDGLHALRDLLEKDLVYVGFVAIRDPLRDDVKAAVAECRAAGIEVKMVTGDNVETARAIGFEIGLIARADEPIDTPGAAVLTTTRFNELTDDELKQQLPKMRILARARPLDKYRLVKLLQELGEVVAVTGDGTNDAPALKKADVGLAMGIAGTEVSKEASKIVLLDDAFSTIVKAVHWGRSLYENIQRFIQFQLTINVSALAITFLGILLFNVKAPFTVLQLLWINVIMDTFASIALCSEPPRPGMMKMPPKKRDENILTPAMVKTIFITASFFIVVMLALLVAMKNGFLADGQPPASGSDYTTRQVSLFFSIYVFFQVWNQINARSLTPAMSGFQRILQNPTFLTIAGIVAVGQIVIVTFGGAVFKVEPLGVLDWLGVIAFTSIVLIFAEVTRRIRLASSSATGVIS
jgi:Ca2+-transporting ATPase